MIQRGPEESSCVGKMRHLTRADARRQARYLRRKTGEEIASYLCRYCNGYHVGHRAPKGFQRRQGQGG